MSLYTIPLQVSPLHYSLFVILTDENLERIKNYDPAEVVTKEIVKALGPPFDWLTLRDIVITYATADEVPVVDRLLTEKKVDEALKLLTRGYRFRPDLGDGLAPEKGP